MTSTLSAVPVARRRRAGRAAVGLAVIIVACGVLAVAGSAALAVRLLGVLVLVGGLLVGLVGLGLLRSISLDAREQALDSVLGSAAACSCGHDHDVDELTVEQAPDHAPEPAPSPPCGSAGDCAHDCASCILAR